VTDGPAPFDAEPNIEPRDLRTRRSALGLTQSELAAVLGVSTNTVARWERGERRVAHASMVRLALEQLERSRHSPTAPAPTSLDLPPQAAALERLPLIGRDADCVALRTLLLRPDVRMVSVTGSAGCGKSALARTVARGLQSEFSDGIYVVDLAALAEPHLLRSAIARPIGIRDTGRYPLAETLRAWLRTRRILLVLDNVEHLLGAASTVAQLLAESQHLRVLATSRVKLNIRWEHQYVLRPLPVPAVEAAETADVLGQNPALSLFVQRARALQPGFTVSPTDVPALTRCLALLDGLPLAIELAAVRRAAIPASQPLELSGSAPPPLSVGLSDIPRRHSSLQTALDWSYALLSSRQQVLLRTLSVFAGAFDWQAARALMADAYTGDADMVMDLQTLIDHSLLVAEDVSGHTRYRFLNTVREYSLDKLRSAGSLDRVQRAHANHYLAAVERLGNNEIGPPQISILDLIDREHDNIRSALGWAIRGGDPLLGLRLATAIWPFWWIRGGLREGVQWLDEALEHATEASLPLRGEARLAMGTLALSELEPRSAVWLQEAVRLMRRAGEPLGLARALTASGYASTFFGQLARANRFFAQAEELVRQTEDAWTRSFLLFGRALLAQFSGDPQGSITYLEQSRHFAEESEDLRGIAYTHVQIGVVHWIGNARQEAYRCFRTALHAFRQVGELWGIGFCIVGLARCAGWVGNWALTTRLAAGAAELHSRTGAMEPTEFGFVPSQVLDDARAHLSDATFNDELARGARSDLDELVEHALAIPEPPPLADGQDAVPHNLPAQPTSLVDRVDELRTLEQELADPQVRLVTLVGPAGSGKTRLAIEAAWRVRSHFPDGVFVVPLADVSDPGMIVAALGEPLGVRDGGAQHLRASLHHRLENRRILLVLDSFEHLMSAAGEIEDLLGLAPSVRMLITSRAVVSIRGSRELQVQPLEVPLATDAPDPDRIRAVPAVALFVHRAQAVAPAFTLNRQTAPAVAELCGLLDGLPLAIELVAARVNAMEPARILSYLRTGQELVSGGPSDVPARHRTITAAINWSYELLAPEQREMLCFLAVFANGSSLTSIRSVWRMTHTGAQGRAALVDRLIVDLVEQSLIVADASRRELRIRMLETVRSFARQRLDVSGQPDRVRQAHAQYFLTLSERAATQFEGPGLEEAMDLLETEYSNIRDALAWTLERGSLDLGLRFVVALHYFWWIRGHLGEGRRWTDTVCAASTTGAADWRARAIMAQALLAGCQGDLDRALVASTESVSAFRAAGDQKWLGRAIAVQATVQLLRHDNNSAAQLLEESLELQTRSGDRWAQGFTLHNLAQLALAQGDVQRADGLIDEARRAFDSIGDLRGHAFTCWTRALVLIVTDEVELARREVVEALSAFRRIREAYGAVVALATLARIELLRGLHKRAAELGSAADALQYTFGRVPLNRYGEDVAAVVNAARVNLDPSSFARASDAGRALDLDQALRYAVDEACDEPGSQSAEVSGPQLDAGDLSNLTRREAEVARLVAAGLSNREIGERLVIAERTVETHLEHIYVKLGIGSRVRLARYVVTGSRNRI
jgi:predicted ATPase/DNA-binding CsgD family transcriptional regulator